MELLSIVLDIFISCIPCNAWIQKRALCSMCILFASFKIRWMLYQHVSTSYWGCKGLWT
jgi:hypothetical protein